MMNRYGYPQKIYDRQWWMNFVDIIYLLHNLEGDKNAIYMRETFLSFIYRATYPNTEDYLKDSPLVSKSGDTYTSKAYVEELFRLLKLRYKLEYPEYTEFNWVEEFEKANTLVNHTLYLEKARVVGNTLIMGEGVVNGTTLFLEGNPYTESRDKITRFGEMMMSIMEQSYDRYSTLLKNYADQKANLLNKVEAITRFNDTPQDSGEFADDRHTTHITTSKNDYDTLMARINEIDRDYRNLLKDWTEEFSVLFIHEEGL